MAYICAELGIGLTTFSPLASGILSGKYNKEIPKGSRATLEGMEWMRNQITHEKIARVEQLADLAKELGMSSSQLAIAWVLRRKDVSAVITGASSLKQLEDNMAAADAVNKLDDAVLDRIERILENLPGDK